MTICPYCNGQNIAGADCCEHCEQPLSDLHLATPDTSLERDLLRDRVQELRPNRPITVTPDRPVREVLRILVEQSIGCVLVVDRGQVVGIFSERDALLKLNTECQELADRPVQEFMTSTPESLDDQAKVVFAVQKMDLGGYRHLPLVNEQGQATGIISVRDILRYLTNRLIAEAY